MRKGKTLKNKKYLSIVFVPHSHDRIRVFKLSGFYRKLVVLSLILVLGLVFAGLYVINLVKENTELRNSVDALSELNIKQKALITEKANEISDLQEKGNNINKAIKEITDKYKEISENYINGRIDGKTSRSGDRSDRSFVKDLTELKDSIASLELNSSSGSGEMANLSQTEKKLDEYIDSLPTLWPTAGRISSGFGGRKDPFRLTNRFHTGIDIAADYGQAIMAAGSGKVTLAGRTSVYGNTVIIDHGNGITSMYGHTSKILVKKGQTVKKGDAIARVGSSGRSTGSHLHFEVQINSVPTNPLNYLDTK